MRGLYVETRGGEPGQVPALRIMRGANRNSERALSRALRGAAGRAGWTPPQTIVDSLIRSAANQPQGQAFGVIRHPCQRERGAMVGELQQAGAAVEAKAVCHWPQHTPPASQPAGAGVSFRRGTLTF